MCISNAFVIRCILYLNQNIKVDDLELFVACFNDMHMTHYIQFSGSLL